MVKLYSPNKLDFVWEHVKISKIFCQKVTYEVEDGINKWFLLFNIFTDDRNSKNVKNAKNLFLPFYEVNSINSNGSKAKSVKLSFPNKRNFVTEHVEVPQ